MSEIEVEGEKPTNNKSKKGKNNNHANDAKGKNTDEQNTPSENGENKGLQTYVSPSEQAMLHRLHRICQLHIEVKNLALSVTSKHPSSVCRSVGSAIVHTHLAAFQNLTASTNGNLW